MSQGQDHTACQAHVQTIYDYAVEIMDNAPTLGTQRDLFEHRLGTAGCLYHREGLTDFIRERDCYREALEQIRDGIFSGNQAAEWARKALEGVRP